MPVDCERCCRVLKLPALLRSRWRCLIRRPLLGRVKTVRGAEMDQPWYWLCTRCEQRLTRRLRASGETERGVPPGAGP